jgi:hypothetical protein
MKIDFPRPSLATPVSHGKIGGGYRTIGGGYRMIG